MYEYMVNKMKYQQLGQKEVEKAREAWKQQNEMYNLSDNGKMELKKQISDKLENNLNKLKRQFIAEAKNGLTNDKLAIQQQRENEAKGKSREQQTLELLQFQQEVALLQAKASILPPEQLMQQLGEITDPKLFTIMQGAILSRCDEQQAMQVRAMKYRDVEMDTIDADIKDCEFLDFKQGYILPLGMDDRTIGDLVFGETMSNYFFQEGNEVK